MSRYFSQNPKIWRAGDDWWDYDAPMLAGIHVPEHDVTDTGLIDVRGNSIMRASNPMGFGKDAEW